MPEKLNDVILLFWCFYFFKGSSELMPILKKILPKVKKAGFHLTGNGLRVRENRPKFLWTWQNIINLIYHLTNVDFSSGVSRSTFQISVLNLAKACNVRRSKQLKLYEQRLLPRLWICNVLTDSWIVLKLIIKPHKLEPWGLFPML